ncbi:MAG: hypothetical protein MJZ66_05770 [Bacteroidales bacterium]|nr:hypothetical protein [Bacteroidales bacterium]
MDDNLKDKFRKGCYPTEADYQALIEAVLKIRDDVSLIKEKLQIPSDTPTTPETPDEPVIPDAPDNPSQINEYLEGYDWLRGDGSRYVPAYRVIPGSNTYKSKDVSIRAIIRPTALNYAAGTLVNVCGCSGSVDGVRYRQMNICLKVVDSNTYQVGYFSCVSNADTSALQFFGNYKVGEILEIEGNENSLTVNGVEYAIANESIQMNMPTFIALYSGSSNGGRSYAGEISKLEYLANGTVYSSLMPAKVVKELPAEMAYDGISKAVDTIGFWDSVNEKFLTSKDANGWSVADEG